MNEFQCIFCGKSIKREEEKVTSLLITTNWEKEEEQEFLNSWINIVDYE